MDASIINAIEATKSKDRNQYRFVKRTESNRLMRGARRVRCEYILELHTERAEAQVSCDGVADVIPAAVMLVTD